jgi:tRNA-2-methylthio-N6-dimethylallyladenosine synthase
LSKRLYIETVGCQMNLLDSELVVASLRKAGWSLVESPREADTILFNTVQRPAARRRQDL